MSESVANVLGPRVGTFAGIGAAGLLLFALSPLQHLTQRIVQTTLGPPPPADRIAFYRSMAQQAWANGNLSRDERRFLDDLRVRLGISIEEAARLETEALRFTTDPMETRS